MSRDADTVRAVIVRDVWPENDFANSAARLSGSDCPGRRSALAALARLEACEAQRDALAEVKVAAEALAEIEWLDDDGPRAVFAVPDWRERQERRHDEAVRTLRAALAEAATREETTP